MPPRSRQTRNQDAASRSRQGQIIDLDPTDGLPVQKYSLQFVQVNQDASTDPATTNTKSTNSAEWAAQFNTPQFPWPENPVPSFFKELSTWNQELLRRARAGNTNAKLSVWDRKNNRWMSAAEAEKKATPLKSLHLNNLDISASEGNGKLANGDAESSKSNDDSDQDSSNESTKSADEDEEEEEAAPFKPVSSSSKKRKLASRLNGPDETRTIEIKRWVQLPPNIAEKTPDKTFLAPRRTGMPPLYNPEYAQKIFGQFHSSSMLSGATGYDLGEGGGLNNASGVLGAGVDNTAGTATPPRKNIPPRRKKKKLGGPGRKKANPNPEVHPQQGVGGDTSTQNAAISGAGQGLSSAMEGVEGTTSGQGVGSATEATGSETPAHHEGDGDGDGDGDDNESGSEAEGSEEGEIDEGGGAEHHTNDEIVPAKEEPQPSVPAPAPAPQVTITDTDTVMADAEQHPKSEAPVELAAETTFAVEEHTSPPVATIDSIEPEIPLQPPADTTTAASVVPSTEIVIPGLGTVANDAEEQNIIDETAEAITSTDVNINADVPLPSVIPEVDVEIAIPGIGEAESTVDATATAIPTIVATTEEPVEVEQAKVEGTVKKTIPEIETAIAEPAEVTDAVVETAQQEPEKEAEMDLLGAMDAAIDRGMSEGA